MDEVIQTITEIETRFSKKFANVKDPQLVFVLSVGALSFPGMMDTIFNLGLNDEICDGLSQKTDNPRFARDTYRRFLQMYGDVAKGLGN